MNVEKIFQNDSGDVIVKTIDKNNYDIGVVQMVSNGCLICKWEVRKVDGEYFPEIKVVHDRLTKQEFSFNILEALRFGQKLAEDVIFYNF